jgi:hypothetical protein
MEPSTWTYNRVTLFLGDINTGTLPSKLGNRISDSKIWSCMSPVGLGPENDCLDEGQQEL